VNELIEYKIPFKGLSSDEHSYQFHITGKFFEAMQSDEDYNCDIKVDMTMNIQSTLIIFNFNYQGNLIFPCDVCLEDYQHPFNYQHRLIVKFGDEISEDDDIVFISLTDYEIDVSQIIFEDIVLNIPLKRVHPLDENGNSTCDPKVLALLNKFQHQRGTDHRWDALKNINFED